LIFFSTIPDLVKDALYLFRGNQPLEIIGEVTNRTDFEYVLIIEQSIVINNDEEDGSFMFLYPNFIIKEGKTVKLKVLPNSRMIVEAYDFKTKN